MGTLNPTDAAFELQRWHPELHISPELASWLLGCSGEDLLLAAHEAVPIERLNKIMQHARHPERGPGDLQARVLHGLAIGAKRIPIRRFDHITFGSRELVMGARRENSMAVFGGPPADLNEQDQRLPIDWTGGKDHGFVLLVASSSPAEEPCVWGHDGNDDRNPCERAGDWHLLTGRVFCDEHAARAAISELDSDAWSRVQAAAAEGGHTREPTPTEASPGVRWWVDTGASFAEVQDERAARIAAADAITDATPVGIDNNEWPEHVEEIAWGHTVTVGWAEDVRDADGQIDWVLSREPAPSSSPRARSLEVLPVDIPRHLVVQAREKLKAAGLTGAASEVDGVLAEADRLRSSSTPEPDGVDVEALRALLVDSRGRWGLGPRVTGNDASVELCRLRRAFDVVLGDSSPTHPANVVNPEKREVEIKTTGPGQPEPDPTTRHPLDDTNDAPTSPRVELPAGDGTWPREDGIIPDRSVYDDRNDARARATGWAGPRLEDAADLRGGAPAGPGWAEVWLDGGWRDVWIDEGEPDETGGVGLYWLNSKTGESDGVDGHRWRGSPKGGRVPQLERPG